MASLPGMFDANNVEPTAPRTLLSPGKYPVQIVQSEMKDTSTGNGQMLALEMDVIDGPDRGRKLWENLNLVNPNQQAVEIANRTLSAICHATGMMQIQDSEELHFKTMIATVAVQVDSRDRALPANDPARRLQNKITGYEPAQQGAGAGYQPAQRQQRTASNGGNNGAGAGATGYQVGNGQGQQQPQPQTQQRQPGPAAQGMPWQRGKPGGQQAGA